MNCTLSDTILASSMVEGKPYEFYTCLNGLVDVIFPLMIHGEHVANLYSGQFFFEEPDIPYFTKQAERFGFPTDEYLSALREIPIVTREEVIIAMDFLQNMTKTITEISYQRLEQIKLREQHEKSERRYRAYMDNAPLGVFITNQFGEYLEVNEEASRLTGYTKEELKGRNLISLIAEESLSEAKDHFKQVIESGRAAGELVYHTKTGERRWWWVVATRVSDDQFLGFALDITAQKSYESALREQEKKIRTIYSVAPVGIGSVNEHRIIKEVNTRICEMVGLTRDELVGSDARILYPTQNDYDFVGSEKYKQIESLGTGVVETRWVTKDGKIIDILLSSTPINPSDETQGVIFTALDISERKRFENALRKSERSLLEAQDLAHVGNWEFDISRNVIHGSEEGFRIYGMAIPPSMEMSIDAIEACILEKRRVHQALIDLIEKDIPYDLEFEINPADGGANKYIISKAVLIKDEHDNPLKVHGVIQDITERKHAEEERKRLVNQLAQAQKMESIGRLAGGVAHDFNNMLGVIQGYTELLIKQMEQESPLFSDLLEIKKAAEYSADLTRQLLTFARKQTVSPQPVALNMRIEEMYNILKRLIGENIELLWKPGQDLPFVLIDPSQLDQILANLCLNARDSITDVGIVTIETKSLLIEESYCCDHPDCKPGEYVILAVSDTGCGMDEETQNHIFEPFFTTKEMGKGTGLGFSTVYGIVKQNKGCINVYSELGHGTTIKILFPSQGIQVPLSKVPPHIQDMEQGHETLLLVEDEPAILRLTQSLLEKLGYTVLASSNPQDAVLLAEQYADPIDLLITDVILPGMNGRALHHALLQHYPNIRCLYMSGYSADIISHQGIIEEGVHFIEKPFSLENMGSKVKQVLRAE